MTAEGVQDMVWDWIMGWVKRDGGTPLERTSTPAANRVISSIHIVSNALLQHQRGGGAAATTLNPHQRVYHVLQGGMNVFLEALAGSSFVRFVGEALALSALALILPTYLHRGDEALSVARQQSEVLEDILNDSGSTGTQKVESVEAWMKEVGGERGLHDGGPLLPTETATTLLLSLLASGRLLSALKANNRARRILEAWRHRGIRGVSNKLFFWMRTSLASEQQLAGVSQDWVDHAQAVLNLIQLHPPHTLPPWVTFSFKLRLEPSSPEGRDVGGGTGGGGQPRFP